MKKTVLVVDDSKVIRQFLSNFLTSEYNVFTVTNGLEAMKWLESYHYCSLIIADLDMPELDGLGFLSLLRTSGFYANIPVIMVSGEKGSQVRIDCLKAGASDYVTKPFNPEELKIKVDKTISDQKWGQIA